MTIKAHIYLKMSATPSTIYLQLAAKYILINRMIDRKTIIISIKVEFQIPHRMGP